MQKKSLSALPLGIYEKAISNHLSWNEKLALAKDSGFDCVEMSIDGTEERACRLYDHGKTSREVNEAIKATGVPFYTMALTANRLYPLGSEDEKIRNKGLELVERAIALAAETGIKLIHLAGYDDHGEKCNERTDALFHEAIARVDAMAEGTGVKLAIETMDTHYMGNSAKIMKLYRDVGTKNMGIYADTGNLTALGYVPADEIRLGGDLILGAHIKDATPGVMRDVVFGEGIVDFDAAFRAFEDIGYQGVFIAEMWSYDKESFHPMLTKASTFLRNILAKY